MSILLHELQQALPAGSSVPPALSALFNWIEQRGLIMKRRDHHVGILHPLDEVQSTWLAPERAGGTYVEFFADATPWLQDAPAEMNARITIFAKTGGDGSYAALWVDDEGRQRIVHLGSGSGSTLLCVLAESTIDFLRLLAIGYDEICWPEYFDAPPKADSRQRILPNQPFRSWVENTFGVTIPRTASEIVRCPASMDDDESPDPFWRWMHEYWRRSEP
jgi:hypothetical protein